MGARTKKMIKTRELLNNDKFKLVNEGDNIDKEVEKIFCCDLLSIAMGRAPSSSAWVTVMANINTFAVATLADVSCVIIAEGMEIDEVTLEKAKERGITLFATEEPVFEAALLAKEIFQL